MKYLLALSFLSLSIYAAVPTNWPELPKKEFIKGRVATQKDVDENRAVFHMEKSSKVISKPIKMEIPQYAYYIQGDKKTPVIVIQAEEFGKNKMYGVRKADGQMLAGMSQEFQLLGSKPPKE